MFHRESHCERKNSRKTETNMWFYMLMNHENNGICLCVFYWDSETENTIFKTCDKGKEQWGVGTPNITSRTYRKV